MTRILILSDLHHEFGRVAMSTGVRCDVVVLGGDIHVGAHDVASHALQASQTFDAPVVLLAGNHEYYDRVPMDRTQDELREAAARSSGQLTFLERDVAEVAGVRFLGCTLWSDFGVLGDAKLSRTMCELAINDFRLIRHREGVAFLPSHAAAEFELATEFLRRELATESTLPTVVVTHHAPSARSIHARFATDPVSGAFASDLDDLVEASGASLWIHGHMHDSFDYVIGQTRVVCNPRGYPHGARFENSKFDPALVIEVAV